MKAGKTILTIVCLALAGGGGWFYWHMQQSSITAVSAEQLASDLAANVPVGNTISTVNNPVIREVDARAGLTLNELLDENFRFFDTSQLSVSELKRLKDEAQFPVYLAEISNESLDTILLKPRLIIRFFNDHNEVATREIAPVPVLYPGEKVPFELRVSEPYTSYKLEWADMKGEQLPGPRLAAQISIVKREARRGSVLVNFSNRYTYKYVSYNAMLENSSEQPIKNAKILITLYDGQNGITGFAEKELSGINLPPGEKYPFEMNVKQFGADFVSEKVVYSTGR